MSYVLSSLRSRLILLVLLSAIPLLALVLYTGFEHRRMAVTEAQRATLTFANEIADAHAQVLDGARQLLIGLAQLPEVLDHNPGTCNTRFATILRQLPLYTVLAAAKPNGDVFCSGLPLKQPVSISDRPYFQESMQERDLAVSGYQIGRISGKATAAVSYPSVDTSGSVRAVVFLGVDIGWLDRVIAQMPLPSGTAVTLINQEGTILYRHPDSEKWVGKPAGDPLVKPDRLLAGERAIIEGPGMDGVPRLFAFSLVRGVDQSRAPIVRVGIPRAWVFADVNRTTRRNIAIMAVVILVALISARTFSNQSLVRPIESLVKATNRLAGGDLGVRTGLPYRAGELGQLAESFDAMADALQTEEAERKQAEQLLRESELRYRTLFEASPSGILLIDPETMLPIDFNPTAHQQLGYSRDEFAKLSISDYEATEKPEETRARVEKILREGRDDFETKHRTKQGNLRNVLVTVQKIDLSGRTVFHNIYRDITNLKREQEKIAILREIDKAITSTLEPKAVLTLLLEKIGALLPYSAAAVMLLNKATGELEPEAVWNINEQRWKKHMTQIRAGSFLGKRILETRTPLAIANLHTDPRPLHPEFFRQEGLVSYLGIPLIAKDQPLGTLTIYSKKEHEFTQEEVEFLTTLAGQASIAIHNAELYEETTKLASDLSRSNSVKDEFLSVMSHELRTPLNVVMGYAAMMKDGVLGDVNPKQEDALGKILGRVNDQLAMINNILYATSIEATKIPVERQAVIPADLFHDLESTYFASTLSPDLTLSWDCPPGLPILETDRAKLKQILQNLIDNAIKFTGKGKITLSARHDPETETVRLRVADTGEGIPADMITAIFEKFRQLDSSETRPYGGVGMGLYIVKKFTEMLGGKIEVESEVGKGSTFTVRLPLHP